MDNETIEKEGIRMQGILFLIYIIGGSTISYEVFWAFWSLVKAIFTFKKKKVPFAWRVQEEELRWGDGKI